MYSKVKWAPHTNLKRPPSDNINVTKIIIMSSIIYSIKQTDFTTIITTKSGIVKVYEFNTIEENNKFYESHS